MWDSEVLHDELKRKYGEIGPLTWEKIQAARAMIVTDAFWKDWEVFEKCAAAISHRYPVFAFSQPPEPEEIAIALRTAERVSKAEYSEDVKRYIAAALLDGGHWYLEPPLDLVQAVVDEHDVRNGIERDRKSVQDLLESQSDYFTNPEYFAQVQANQVLSIREGLADYDREVREQLARLKEKR